MRKLVNILIALAKRRTHPDGHIYSADGSLYMERWSLLETRWLSIRVHRIARPDNDRHFHDHPWPWASLVLRGGYIELLPASADPCFNQALGEEYSIPKWRGTGSLVLRHATDRHRISSVLPNTYTLFIIGRKRQSWGFFTPEGKVYWRDYLDARA